MNNLYGCVEPDTGAQPATRQSHRAIEAWVQTERGRVTVRLTASGDFTVETAPVGSGYAKVAREERLVLRGNVNEGRFEPRIPEPAAELAS